MAKNDGGPAFPEPERWSRKTNEPYTRAHGYRRPGMSLRDYFAGQALALGEGVWAAQGDRAKIARNCYEIADAMLAEREENDG